MWPGRYVECGWTGYERGVREGEGDEWGGEENKEETGTREGGGIQREGVRETIRNSQRKVLNYYAKTVYSSTTVLYRVTYFSSCYDYHR